jgi:alkylation response protein AidB-like acyl-CoA dehydrogenase
VDLRLSEEQAALAEGIRSLCAGRLPLDQIRREEDDEITATPEQWTTLGEAGVFSLKVPEADGGLGLGLADAAVVFEELGRALVPGPLVGTFLAAGLVEGASEGEVMVAVTSFHANPTIPLLVEHLASAPCLLALPGCDERRPARLVRTPELGAERVAGALDPLTPLWQVSGVLPEGRPLGDAASGPELLRDGTTLTAALQVGTAAACVEMAVAYAKERQQFGRPIGSFQAVKHLCADMLVRAEVARCAVHAAALLVDQPDVAETEADVHGRRALDFTWRAVAGAKLLADEAALANARSCIQVHGGMGFTWQVPVHLHLKRARVRAASFGSPAALAEEVAALL